MTIRVTEHLKQAMAEFELNWSEYIRTAIQQKIIDMKREQAFQELEEVKIHKKGRKTKMSDEVIKWRKRH